MVINNRLIEEKTWIFRPKKFTKTPKEKHPIKNEVERNISWTEFKWILVLDDWKFVSFLFFSLIFFIHSLFTQVSKPKPTEKIWWTNKQTQRGRIPEKTQWKIWKWPKINRESFLTKPTNWTKIKLQKPKTNFFFGKFFEKKHLF